MILMQEELIARRAFSAFFVCFTQKFSAACELENAQRLHRRKLLLYKPDEFTAP